MKVKPLLPAHVDIRDLRAVLDEELPKLSPAPSDSARGFVESTLNWVLNWTERHASKSFVGFAPFVILFDDSTAEAAGWEIWDFFREELPFDVSAKIFASSSAMFVVRVMSTTAASLRDLGKEVSHHRLETCPAVVVDPSNGQLILCFEGTRKEARIKLSLTAPPIVDVDEGTVDAALNEFERDFTRYPDGYTWLWFDRPKRIMLRDAEAIVRDALLLLLRLKMFRSQHVAREVSLTVGRPDISILDRRTNQWVCVFELKVLRSRGMPRNPGSGRGTKSYTLEFNERHARQGVRQAQKYKDATAAPLAYVCCFDGRDEFGFLSRIQDLCAEHGVLYRQYYMETSTRNDLKD